MRTLIFCIAMLCAITINAQEIIPIEDHEKYVESLGEDGEIPEGTYIKDVNNLLGKYIGTWKCTYGGKSYEFRFTKIREEFLGISRDVLKVRFLVKDAQGNELANTLNLPDEDVAFTSHRFDGPNNEMHVLYYVENILCNMKGWVHISLDNPSKMRFSFNYEPDSVTKNDCPWYETMKPKIPVDTVFLDKQ